MIQNKWKFHSFCCRKWWRKKKNKLLEEFQRWIYFWSKSNFCIFSCQWNSVIFIWFDIFVCIQFINWSMSNVQFNWLNRENKHLIYLWYFRFRRWQQKKNTHTYIVHKTKINAGEWFQLNWPTVYVKYEMLMQISFKQQISQNQNWYLIVWLISCHYGDDQVGINKIKVDHRLLYIKPLCYTKKPFCYYINIYIGCRSKNWMLKRFTFQIFFGWMRTFFNEYWNKQIFRLCYIIIYISYMILKWKFVFPFLVIRFVEFYHLDYLWYTDLMNKNC